MPSPWDDPDLAPQPGRFLAVGETAAGVLSAIRTEQSKYGVDVVLVLSGREVAIRHNSTPHKLLWKRQPAIGSHITLHRKTQGGEGKAADWDVTIREATPEDSGQPAW